MTNREKAQEIVKKHEKFADAGALVTEELKINAINAAILSLEYTIEISDSVYDDFNTRNTNALNKLLEQRLILSELRIMLLELITDNFRLLPHLMIMDNISNQPSTTLTNNLDDKSN